ncbi:MAG: calcium-binding protein [Pseudomonadota bacterium]
MPSFIISSSSISSSTLNLLSDLNAFIVIEDGVTVANTTTTGIRGAGGFQLFLIDGNLITVGSGLISDGDYATVSVSGQFNNGGAGILTTGDDSRITVSGEVTANGDGIVSRGDGAEILVTQTGVVQGDQRGVELGSIFSIRVEDLQRLTNEGTIAGTISGVAVFRDATIVNSGLITNTGATETTALHGAIVLEDDTDISARIINTGDIIGTGVVNTLGGVDDPVAIVAELDNRLSIDVTNSGLIRGNIIAAEIEDKIVNTGQIIGDVDLGDGNDLLRNSGDGMVVGVVEGQGGQDTLIGGDREDTFNGGSDNDLINGKGGNDRLRAGGGDDTVFGGAGDDELFGQNGKNVLSGQGGNDVINGGIGSDRLLGGNGDDTLTAGEGADILRGDAGADVFVFSNVGETGAGATRDRILGWEDGADLIDLSGFGALEFSASGAVGGGTASVWFDAVSGGTQTMLRIDADGNGSVDGQVLLVHADPALFDQNDLILG